ncbi:DUF559 domain-containing protein [Nocardioides sp. BP30]|uniref:DUF559 domain-containing protein n=1 Tax=Nocardioides sp. BP30 TaxID=3036374 RepID=UPI002469A7A7|nr:DUF559 domain-containing protein [Nocardioides sp. BP30]WGL50888.1 DUF559 domain-containing protein [Nocardioides sp. BP30]
MTTPTIVIPDRPFRRAELLELGLTRRDFYRLVEDGVIRAVVREAFVRADLEDTTRLRAAAVSLAVAEGHVAVDRTAAAIHGVNTFTYVELEEPPPVETCVLRGANPTQRRDVRGRTRDLAPGDIMVIDGLRVTTPLRTALDLGCHLRRREAMAALNTFGRLHAVSADDLRVLLPRFHRRRGVIQLRELAQLVEPRIESARESWTWLEIHDAGLPMPEPQVWIEIDGVPTYRLDFAYERRRIAIEYDGAEFHDRTDEQRRHDAARRAWLRKNGWTVIVIRSGDFTGERRDRWIRELRLALAATYDNRRW